MLKKFFTISTNTTQNDTRGGIGYDPNGSSGRPDIKSNSLNESMSSVVTSFSIYKLLSELIKPFTQLDAYREGIIDREGNFKKDVLSLNKKQKAILTPFNRLVIGIKRLIRSSGSSRLKADYSYLQTAAKAMAFECKEVGGNDALFLEELEKCINVLLEDESIGNAVGNEAIANLDLKTGGPVIRPKRKNKSGILMRVRRSLKDM
jgi:hypothetical protein